MLMIFIIIFSVLIMLSVAFYTLMERKIISMNQIRLGPNKVSFGGILQPVLDGLKLFLKNINPTFKSNFLFFFSPIISFIFSYSIWFPIFFFSLNFKFLSFLFFFCVMVYSFVLAGWASFSKFGYIGGIRASSQTVSYEVSLTIVFFITIFFFQSFNFFLKKEFLFIYLLPFFLIWLFIIISETNRAPFDFSEGESELISGFNVEYGSSGFVLFFLSEYSMMIFFCFFLKILMNLNFIFFMVFLYLFILMRTSYPRFRYDFLLQMMWLKILPFVCFFLCFVIFL